LKAQARESAGFLVKSLFIRVLMPETQFSFTCPSSGAWFGQGRPQGKTIRKIKIPACGWCKTPLAPA